ncbi:hypothetical protein HAX54_028358, partial [Datura stramonium]|nr:hypothetical protein [Datura stramonium]
MVAQIVTEFDPYMARACECLFKKWFSPIKKAEQQIQIFYFRNIPREQLFEAWKCFKQYILRAPNHWFPEHIFLEKFYTSLDPLTYPIVNNATGGCFMDMTFNWIAIILDWI